VMAAWAMTTLFAFGTSEFAPTVFPSRDFIEYWSAARVHVQGGDPYDGAQILPYQRAASGDPGRTEAVMLWTPPWTLPLYLPFGVLDPRSGHLLWLVVQTACVLWSSWLLWRSFGGAVGTGWRRAVWALIPLGLAVSFAPVWWLVIYGQNTGFVLLGLAGFLSLRGKGFPLAAGAVGALTAVKPHLLALFGLALLLDASTRAGRRVLLGGLAALALGAAAALAPDREVFRQFADALDRPPTPESVPLSHWQVPTIGYKLREAVLGGVFDHAGELF